MVDTFLLPRVLGKEETGSDILLLRVLGADVDLTWTDAYITRT